MPPTEAQAVEVGPGKCAPKDDAAAPEAKKDHGKKSKDDEKGNQDEQGNDD